jgi:D-proline reductase (dithiol) PrdB
VSLVARHLEANGIATVIIGSALDIVEHCGVPRFLFTDFPLGNPCGHPCRRDMQASIVELALRSLASAVGARSTIRAPFAWKDAPGWRDRYGRVDPAERERLVALGRARRERQAAAQRSKRLPSAG